MKKIFISQPMNGLSDEGIKKERARIRRTCELKYGDVEIIDSFFENAPHEAKPLWFLGTSIELLSTADVAFFAKGWENARGCKIENVCAKEYGITVMEE